MESTIWLIPFLPLASAATLLVLALYLPRQLVVLLGVGSVGAAALVTATVAYTYVGESSVITQSVWSWMAVGNFNPQVAFYIDGLTVVMMSIITGVGFLIHLFSADYMADDPSLARYFGYLNLFVASMLVLVMADNLLFLYLGWEGVGVCSYLLIGFWYREPANTVAARKAFVVTRVGDTAMALGLLLLFTELGTLQIQPMLQAANNSWASGQTLPVLATFLLLGGAVGKSAQLPLHTWLPDAMAGPTPVSALIHAATMVTAGVYLIARTHELFLLAPVTQATVAWIGVLTMLLAACAALVQQDIKRILAYSTISQIGYMFLALGVSAVSAGIFHLMTHAFFKALLFLSAGAVLHCLHHEHNIFRMGGLRTRLPVVFWSFVIGSAALAALPFTSGFYSKDAILLSAWTMPQYGPWLWLGGLIGALLTAIYSFRLVFVVFFGPAHTEPDRQPGWRMAVPLAVLCLLSIIGGWIALPLSGVFSNEATASTNHSIEWIAIATPIAGLTIAYLLFLGRQLSLAKLQQSTTVQALAEFWQAGWRVDALYKLLWVIPYQTLARWWQSEPVDQLYNAVVSISQLGHRSLTATQTGQLRWYATAMAFGVILLLAIILRSGS